jgi:hypothetical protein
VNWFRWYHGTWNDPKLIAIAFKLKIPLAFVVSMWDALMDYASRADCRGSIEGFDLDAVAIVLGLELDKAEAVWAIMQNRLMISADGKSLVNFQKRQDIEEKPEPISDAERTRRYREKKMAAASVTNVTSVTLPTSHVTNVTNVTDVTTRGEERRRDTSTTASSDGSSFIEKTNTGNASVSGIGAADVWREPGPELDQMALNLAVELNAAWPWSGLVKYIAQDILNVLVSAQVHHEANQAAPSAEATAATIRANCLAWAAHYLEAQRMGRTKKVSLSFCITAGEWMAPPKAGEAVSDADSRFAAAMAARGRSV